MTTIKLRRGTSAQWTATNPILSEGEPGYETDTGLMKLGNGVSPWAELDDFVLQPTLDQVQAQLDAKQDEGWAGMPPGSGCWIQFDKTTNTWPPSPTSRLDIHLEYQGGDASHPPPGRAGTTVDDGWTWDTP